VKAPLDVLCMKTFRQKERLLVGYRVFILKLVEGDCMDRRAEKWGAVLGEQSELQHSRKNHGMVWPAGMIKEDEKNFETPNKIKVGLGRFLKHQMN